MLCNIVKMILILCFAYQNHEDLNSTYLSVLQLGVQVRNTIWMDLGKISYHTDYTSILFKDSAADLGNTVDNESKLYQLVANIVQKARTVAMNLLKVSQ